MSLDLRPRASPTASSSAQPLIAQPGPRTGRTGTTLNALSGSERLLWEASERLLRQPKDKLVLVVHLSRLTPRPYHLRVARVLLQDGASRTGGQVFTMRNDDVVLLCTRPTDSEPAPQRPLGASRTSATPGRGSQVETIPGPETLPATLATLFSADMPDASDLVSLWYLDRDVEAVFAYLAERAGSADMETGRASPADARISVFGLPEFLSRAPLAHFISRQIGMSLSPDRGRSLADRLAPAFCEIGVVLPDFDPNPAGLPTEDDPFLRRHLASGLDADVIQLLSADISEGGLLTRVAVQAGLPIHIGLGLGAILSPAFARLSYHAAEQGVRFGACISLMQACADLDLVEQARRALKLTGGDLVLSHVEPAALAFVVPACLQPDLLKLTWSARLPGIDQPAGETRFGAGLDGIDPTRVVLQGVQSPEAFAWGQARGITLFQGPFLDQIQAAMRMAACPSAGGCTLRQCCDRARAADGPGRAGCGNPALLDSGFGPP